MAETVRYIPDQQGLRKLLTGPTGEVARMLARKAIRVESAAKRIATEERLVDSGRYRASISWRLGVDGRGLFAEIGSALPYARIIEFGSPPHIIEPRNKKALFWKDADHPVRRVRHPGTRPYNVLRRALLAVLIRG